MGREDFSQSSQLTTLVGKPTNRYKKLPKTVGTIKSLTQARAKPNNRLHYSAYPLIQKEYSATYTQLTNLDFYSPIITILGNNPVSHYVGTPYVDAGVKVDEGSELYSTESTVDASEFGSYSVVYKARDGINADTTVTRIVKVGLPPDATINGQNPVTLERYGVYADDGITINESNSVLISTTSTLNNTIVGTYTVNYTVSNSAYTKVFSRTVRVDDTTPPVITITGGTPYELERFDPYVDEGATVDLGSELTNTDLSQVQNTAIGSFNVVYTAYDGNTTVTATRTVNVVDTVPPVITILNNTPQENILERFGVYVDAGATVDLGSILTVDDSAVDNTLAHNSTFDVIYSATDGNTLHDVTSTRTVTIKDTVLPVLNLIGNNPYNIQPLIDFETVDPGYSNDASTIVTVDYSQVTTGDNDIFNVTYTGDDGVHAPIVLTREIRVDDTLRPVITILGDNPYTHERFAVYTDPGATVDLGSTLIRTDNLVTANVDIVGSYYVEYEAEDGFNENTIERRIVNVVDTTAPVITLTDGGTPGSSTVTIERFSTYTDPGATADGGETVSNNASSNLNTSVVGEYWITFTATDPSGNEGRADRRVIVQDTVAPQVTLNNASQSYTIERYSDWSTVDPGVTVDEGSYLHAVNIDTSLYGSQNVEYVVRDGTNETTILRPITIQDTVAPVITLTGANPYTVERGTTYTDPGATTDTGESVTINTSGLNMASTGTYIVTYTATDAGNNTTTVFRTVTVQDTVAPVITLTGANPYTVERLSTYNDPGATADTGETVTNNSSTTVDMDTVGSYTVTYTATDSSGNSGTATRTVLVADTVAPVITLTGANPYTVERLSTYNDPGATADTGETVTNNSSTTVDMDNTGSYTVTYTATDSSGNIGTATRTVLVADTVAPNIILADGDTVGSSTYTVERGTTYTDPGYSADTGESVTINTIGLNMSTSGTYIVTYSATDSSGNTGTAQRTVIVQDSQGPVITLTGANPYTVERLDTYTDPGATADTGETVTNNSSTTVDMDNVGNYTVTYSATDADGNTGITTRTVQVRDTTAPVITLTNGDPGTTDYTVQRYSTYTDPGSSADTGENVSDNRSSNLNMNVVGTYWITYYATDSSGNTGEVTRRVIVEDTTAPVITLQGDNPYTVQRGTTYTDPGWTVDTGETVTADVSTLNMSVSGTYTVSYTATDASGNTGTASRTVTVEDTENPVITLTGANPYTVEWGATYNDPGATADTGETVTNNSSTAVDMNTIGDYTVTYTATDNDNNTGTTTRTVYVRDTTAPIINLTNGNVGTTDYTVEMGSTYTDPGYSADTGESVTIDTSGLNMNAVGNYTVSYSATDASGNTGTASRNVYVRDTTAPVITLTEGTSIVRVATSGSYTDPGYSADTGETVTVNFSAVNMSTSGTYTVYYSATDASGNTGTATRSVRILAREPLTGSYNYYTTGSNGSTQAYYFKRHTGCSSFYDDIVRWDNTNISTSVTSGSMPYYDGNFWEYHYDTTATFGLSAYDVPCAPFYPGITIHGADYHPIYRQEQE